MRKVRADRRLWAAAQSLPELGELMARWLEGELSMWPGYDDGAAEETAALIPVLARVNRAGFLTDTSQPGFDGPGFDGARWEQRAALSGLVSDYELLSALGHAAETLRLTLLVRDVESHGLLAGVTATRVDGAPYTTFGARLSRRQLRHLWRGVSRPALNEICDAWQVTLVDPEWGSGDRLWTALHEAISLHEMSS
ncbi:DUF6919 domain-containing protein [Streptomyces venezuelae]